MELKRRRFTQGAVIATLASRPAWAQTCDGTLISANTVLSFTGGSLSPGQDDLLTQLRDATADPTKEVTQNPDQSICITDVQPQPDGLFTGPLDNKLLRQRERFKEERP